jgi:hypothetical protein
MEAAIANVLEADYQQLGLRTRGRSHGEAECHTPGCGHSVAAGKRFCSGCQATLDRVREELKAAKPRAGRKRIRGAGKRIRAVA